MRHNGFTYKNRTDLAFGALAFIPGVGWIISAAYFQGDPLIEKATGKNISVHIEETVKKSANTTSNLWNTLLSGFSNFSSAINKGWGPR